MYYVYMLRCKDNSIYTGITTDIERRMSEHLNKEKGAKYTKRHVALQMERIWSAENRSLASKLEYRIKRNLTKHEKEKLIKDPNLLRILLEDKIDYTKYSVIED